MNQTAEQVDIAEPYHSTDRRSDDYREWSRAEERRRMVFHGIEIIEVEFCQTNIIVVGTRDKFGNEMLLRDETGQLFNARTEFERCGSRFLAGLDVIDRIKVALTYRYRR